MKEKPFGYLRLKSGKFFYDVEGVPNLGEPSSGYIAMYTEPQLNSASATWRECCEDWLKRTDWVQERKDWPFPALGMHRVDVMTQYIQHLEALVKSHPAPAVAQEPEVFPGDALRWGLKECGVSQTDNGVHFPESALAKLAAILACAYTNRVLAQKPESVTFDNDAAWNLAQKVRTDLDRKACPGAFMDLAMESINRHYTKAPAVADFSDAYHGAREDLAIWKKRALEAEELNRKFIADINGQTFMGDPAPAGAQEPVHFRAVLCGEQQDQAFGVVPKVVGFVDKKAAEQFILEKRDFQGWRYSLEPLYREAPAVAVNERVGVIERYGYQALFNAIAEATKIEGGQIGVSVIAFAKSLEAAIAHRDAQPAVAVDDQFAVLIKKANDQAEHFEREWYLRGDELEALEQVNAQLLEALKELMYARTDKAEGMADAAIAQAEAAKGGV